jgi:hypothetical protein
LRAKDVFIELASSLLSTPHIGHQQGRGIGRRDETESCNMIGSDSNSGGIARSWPPTFAPTARQGERAAAMLQMRSGQKPDARFDTWPRGASVSPTAVRRDALPGRTARTLDDDQTVTVVCVGFIHQLHVDL